MKGKKSFTAYCDWQSTFDSLPDDKAGKLIKHLFAYVNDENPITDDILINVAFAGIKQTLKRDLEKWMKICERNQSNGNKGGRPTEPKKPSGLFGLPNNPNKPDSDSDSDSDSDNIKRKSFTPPALQEVRDYEIEKDYTNQAYKFVNFYTSKGWMVGKNKMKNWKAARSNWENKNETKNKVTWG